MFFSALLRQGDEGYSVPIIAELEEKTGREISPAAVYIALRRLEEKGLLGSHLRSADPSDGGRERRYYAITPEGMGRMAEARRSPHEPLGRYGAQIGGGPMKPLGERLLRVVLPPTDRQHILDELDELHRSQDVESRAKPPLNGGAGNRSGASSSRLFPPSGGGDLFPGFSRPWPNETGSWALWDTLRQDLRFAFRSFRRRPGFSLAAILILGVGIGATTTIFSVVDTVMLRPLPYPEPGSWWPSVEA